MTTRYCPLCDAWVQGRECPKCGADTMPRGKTMTPTEQERQFPLLRLFSLGTLTSMPWAMLAPHEAQALHNHDQTLERLAQRGGLSACEVIAILDDSGYFEYWRWSVPSVAEAEAKLCELIAAWRQTQSLDALHAKERGDTP